MLRQFLHRIAVSLSSLCLLTACGGSGGVTNQAAHGSASAIDTPSDSPPTLPGTKPSAHQPKPVTVDAPCPYLDTGTVMDTIGQHLTRSTVTSTRPHPSCAFYRPDGALAATITVSAQANPIAAQNDALAKVGRGSNPVNGVGDYGVVTILDDGALLAVAKGTALVLVKINQKSSLEAKEIARAVVAKL